MIIIYGNNVVRHLKLYTNKQTLLTAYLMRESYASETRSDALLSYKNLFLNLHLCFNTDALYSVINDVRVTIPTFLFCQKYIKASKKNFFSN